MTVDLAKLLRLHACFRHRTVMSSQRFSMPGPAMFYDMSTQHGQLLDHGPDVRVKREPSVPGGARISVHGCLDDANGQSLLVAVDNLACGGLTHIRVDLREITGFTPNGVAAASDCCRKASALPCGVSFLVSAGTSRTALLEIFARN
jgi:hypothetical protein